MLKDDFNFFQSKITISNSMDVDLISGIACVDFFATTKLIDLLPVLKNGDS